MVIGKQIVNGDEARQVILRGVNKLADAVKATLGPGGHVIAIERPMGDPIITKDGVTVAKSIYLSDPLENMGAQMVRQVASKTVDVVGDGTTTATLLAQFIFSEGVRVVTAGANSVALKRGIDQAVEAVVTELQRIRKPVKGEMIANVGAISANGDRQIGEIIADAMKRVGDDGVITVEESNSLDTSLEVVEGMQFDRGYISPNFVTNFERMDCVLEDVRILIHERPIRSTKELLPLLELVAGQGKPLLIIAENVEGDALATMVVNKVRGTLSCAAVKSPGYADRRKAMLEDIAAVTGGKAITQESGIKLAAVKVEDLGIAKKVIITATNITIVEGAGKEAEIQERIRRIRTLIDQSENDYDRDKMKERLAKLTGGVAIIRIGAATEIEMKEKKDRVEDAMHATRAAVQEGIVAGGGTALVRCIAGLSKLSLSADETVGVNIVKRALEEPFRQIVKNAGYESSVILAKILESKSTNFGFNAASGQYGDLVAAGVIDPAKVTRLALQNAASIAGLMLITEGLVAHIPDNSTQQTNS
jgi:chaperonin GroEL